MPGMHATEENTIIKTPFLRTRCQAKNSYLMHRWLEPSHLLGTSGLQLLQDPNVSPLSTLARLGCTMSQRGLCSGFTQLYEHRCPTGTFPQFKCICVHQTLNDQNLPK